MRDPGQWMVVEQYIAHGAAAQGRDAPQQADAYPVHLPLARRQRSGHGFSDDGNHEKRVQQGCGFEGRVHAWDDRSGEQREGSGGGTPLAVGDFESSRKE